MPSAAETNRKPELEPSTIKFNEEHFIDPLSNFSLRESRGGRTIRTSAHSIKYFCKEAQAQHFIDLAKQHGFDPHIVHQGEHYKLLDRQPAQVEPDQTLIFIHDTNLKNISRFREILSQSYFT